MNNINNILEEGKYLSGSGNTFTAFDNQEHNLPKDFFSENAKRLTNPINSTMQTEGILVLHKSKNYDFEVWFFNPDGSSGMMCGNGGRCAIYFALECGYSPNYKDEDVLNFEMNEKIYSGKKKNDLYSIFFSKPNVFPKEVAVEIDAQVFDGFYVDVGTDHFVAETNNLANFDIDYFGKKIRNDNSFAPSGTNVNFYEKLNYTNENDLTILNLRTYERGVEKETGACGTGAISTALVLAYKEKKLTPITIFPTSNSPLFIEFITGNSVNKKAITSDINFSDINSIVSIILTGFVEEI